MKRLSANFEIKVTLKLGDYGDTCIIRFEITWSGLCSQGWIEQAFVHDWRVCIGSLGMPQTPTLSLL